MVTIAHFVYGNFNFWWYVVKCPLFLECLFWAKIYWNMTIVKTSWLISSFWLCVQYSRWWYWRRDTFTSIQGTAVVIVVFAAYVLFFIVNVYGAEYLHRCHHIGLNGFLTCSQVISQWLRMFSVNMMFRFVKQCIYHVS